MRLGAVQLSREFSGFFWNLFSFSLRYFYLLEGSKIFFMSTNYRLFMPRSISGNFLGIFGIFGVFLVPCKHFLEFPNLFLRWKIFRKNLILPYLGRARRLDPVRFGPARQSPSGPGQAAAAANLACAPRPTQACAPI
jgi:hypothetical protein